ncbi:MAG TPA: DUF3883 domain-containing protein [Armatimonadota bacterium]|nr:DUF3883 domain-containing protein [Armatimonadota bacterium]
MRTTQIRDAAMRLATELLKADGWQVSTGGPGYDLTATRGDDELHIEVKGAGGAVRSVGGFRYLTKNEFDAARKDPNWQMWVFENLDGSAPATVTRIMGDEVLKHAEMEPRWFLPMRWCREHCESIAPETCARALDRQPTDSTR